LTSTPSNHANSPDVIITLDDSRPLRIAIADDHTMFSHLVVGLLEANGYAIAGVFDGTEGDLEAAVLASRPDLLLLDLHLGTRHDPSIPLISRFAEAGVQVVVVTASEDRMELAACLEAGAYGFVPKSRSVDSLLTAIDDAARGRPLISSLERMSLIIDLRFEREYRQRRWEPFERLTQRESEVLEMLCSGRAAAEIAEESFVSLATVRSQIRSILNKLGVNSQLAAVGLAREARWNGNE
jgi:DNA-binding NarL/FixJ family response regulator